MVRKLSGKKTNVITEYRRWECFRREIRVNILLHANWWGMKEKSEKWLGFGDIVYFWLQSALLQIMTKSIIDHQLTDIMFIFIQVFNGHHHFLLKILNTEHDRKKPNHHLRVPPPGPANWARAPRPVLHSAPGRVCYHRPGNLLIMFLDSRDLTHTPMYFFQ